MQQYKALKDFEVGPEESHTSYEAGAIFDDSNVNLDIPTLISDGTIEAVEETSAPKTELVDHEISQEDLDANPELVADGVKVGDVIELPMLVDEEDIAKAKAEHEAPAAPVVEEVPAETTPDVTLVYKGKKVISTGTETINGVQYQRLALEDGTVVNVAEDEYRREVSVA